MSFSFTKTTTFTIAQARYLASKAAADMHLCAQCERLKRQTVQPASGRVVVTIRCPVARAIERRSAARSLERESRLKACLVSRRKLEEGGILRQEIEEDRPVTST